MWANIFQTHPINRLFLSIDPIKFSEFVTASSNVLPSIRTLNVVSWRDILVHTILISPRSYNSYFALINIKIVIATLAI